MSFYVTLLSHSDRRQFPNNQANWFKIRLPHPLRLPGGQRQVGLSAISLPDTRVNLYELVAKGNHVLGIKWHQKVPSQSEKGGTNDQYGAAGTKIDDIKDWNWVLDGVSFMKAAIAHVEQKRGQCKQLGDGVGAVVSGIPKAAWKITKVLETLAKKNARKSHLKRMTEIKSGKRKRYAGESFTCSIMIVVVVYKKRRVT